MQMFATACPWYVAGPLLGLLVAGLLWTINKPLGALGGYVDSVKWLVRRGSVDLARLVPPGHCPRRRALGPRRGKWQCTLSYGVFTSSFGAILGTGGVVLFAAGTLIAYGARLGGGCISGHGMCGMAFASSASIVCTMTFMSIAVVAANLLLISIGSGS